MTQYTPEKARELAIFLDNFKTSSHRDCDGKPMHTATADALRSLADQLEQANLQHITEDGERQDAWASASKELASMPQYWSVAVNVDGSDIVSIGHNWLSGNRPLESNDEQTILGAAQHLLSFIGYGMPKSSFDPDDAAAPAVPAPVARPAPFHPSASHIHPEYRDGWNAALAATAPQAAPVAQLSEPPAQAEIEALRTDAERYRWLRTPPNNINMSVYGPTGGLLRRDEYLDAAIDVAIDGIRAAAPTTPKG